MTGLPVPTLTDVSRHFVLGGGFLGLGAPRIVKAVAGESLILQRGETLALVRESGCGKCTLGRLVLRLIEPTGGGIKLGDTDLRAPPVADLRRMRRLMQIIFQDPFASLNPHMSVFGTLAEPIVLHGLASGAALEGRVHELLDLVGLQPFHGERFPHEFPCGQRQRIGVARALATNPELAVCDEPVSALDVSIQTQMVNLVADLQARFALTYLFIVQDLAVVKHIATRVAVMYLGKIVELPPKSALYATPRQPYIQALPAAAPRPDPGLPRNGRTLLQGDPPSPLNPPTGYAFRPRCIHAVERCRNEAPALRTTLDGEQVACHLAEQVPLRAPEPAAAHSPILVHRQAFLAAGPLATRRETSPS
jgi:oligopeptide transport system ATP-binding protein